ERGEGGGSSAGRGRQRRGPRPVPGHAQPAAGGPGREALAEERLSEVDRWLEPPLRDAPPSLRRRVEQALRAQAPKAGTPVSSALRAAADALLAEANDGDSGRETALTLLAADALVTYACEAAAEADPHSLREAR